MDPIGLAVDILKESLDAEVSTEIPKDRQARYVMVGLDGDESTPFLLRPRLALTCWGSSDRDAFSLAISAAEALRDAAMDHPYLSSADLETMSREEWSRTGQSRYLAIITLTINVD
jgi:hypothetical protein